MPALKTVGGDLVKSTKSIKGVTLIEMLVVLAILTIIAGIGTPSLQSLIQSQRVTTSVNELLAAVTLARSEAIQRGIRVDLVPAGDGTDWDKGWVVFIDQDNDQRPDADERVIFMHGPVPAGIHITSRLTANQPIYLAYTGTGRTRTNAGAFQAGSFVVQGQNSSRKLVINSAGRPRICNPAADC